MNNIAPHPNPVWPCDSLVVADLSSHGMPGRFEQFWTRRVSDTRFEIACVPFFTYDIALGDTVEVGTDGVIQRVVNKSGHRTLRLAVMNESEVAALHLVLHEWALNTGLFYEWHGSGYLAVDVPPSSQGKFDTSVLDELSSAGQISVEMDE